jgi:hypothetical protein
MRPPEGSIGELGTAPSDVADLLHERRDLSYPHAWDFNVVIGGRFSSYPKTRLDRDLHRNDCATTSQLHVFS